jgi:hypothetical protein
VDRVHKVVDQRRHGPWWTMDRGATGACRHCGDRLLAAMARGAKGRCGEPADGLTWGGEVVRRASGGGERNPAEAVASKHSGREGEERGARMSAVEMVGGVVPFYRVGEAIGRGGWPGGSGDSIPVVLKSKRGRRVDGAASS